MTNAYLVSRFAEIDAVIQKVKSSPGVDLELQAYLSSYLVVLICGIFEDCVEYLAGERAAKSGDKEVERFVRECISQFFRSPKFEYVCKLVGLFSDSYKKMLEKKIDGQARTALGSIVTHKMSVAHGSPAKVTLGEVEKYYNTSKTLFDALEQILR